MARVKWFVLPPAMEWYYRKNHLDYEPLPPFRHDCLAYVEQGRAESLSLIYPGGRSEIYVPVELNGRRGRAVFEAAHRDPQATIFWHLDDQYLGCTREIHQMALAPSPGSHMITLVDENGEQIQRGFTVLAKE
jgi:penicillin-binding protein 1C